jgi:hypothetical protein
VHARVQVVSAQAQLVHTAGAGERLAEVARAAAGSPEQGRFRLRRIAQPPLLPLPPVPAAAPCRAAGAAAAGLGCREAAPPHDLPLPLAQVLAVHPRQERRHRRQLSRRPQGLRRRPALRQGPALRHGQLPNRQRLHPPEPVHLDLQLGAVSGRAGGRLAEPAASQPTLAQLSLARAVCAQARPPGRGLSCACCLHLSCSTRACPQPMRRAQGADAFITMLGSSPAPIRNAPRTAS